MWIKNGYAIGIMSYSIGVLLARSSLFLFKIRKVEIFTIVESVNVTGWLMQAIFVFVKTPWILFAWLIVDGLMDGCAYANNYNLLYEQQNLSFKEKELGSTLLALSYDGGILCSGIISLVLDQTCLKV